MIRLFALPLMIALLVAGCVQPKAVEITPQTTANVPLLSPQGNSVASPNTASGNTATIPIAAAVSTSQPVDQRATLGGGAQTAGGDQRIAYDNRPINIQVPGGELVALALVIGVVVIGVVGLVKHHVAAVTNRRLHDAADRHIGEILRMYALTRRSS